MYMCYSVLFLALIAMLGIMVFYVFPCVFFFYQKYFKKKQDSDD